MGLFNSNNKVIENNPLSQEHIGIVIDVNDPKNLCRIRVTIPGILDTDNQVWFTRIAPNFPGVTYETPVLGQKIRVWFRNNSIKSGVYGLDYTHKDTKMALFKPGEYGFADMNSNTLKISGATTSYSTGTFNLKGNLNVKGKMGCSSGYTGSFSTGDGGIVTVVDGIITSVDSSSS